MTSFLIACLSLSFAAVAVSALAYRAFLAWLSHEPQTKKLAADLASESSERSEQLAELSRKLRELEQRQLGAAALTIAKGRR